MFVKLNVILDKHFLCSIDSSCSTIIFSWDMRFVTERKMEMHKTLSPLILHYLWTLRWISCRFESIRSNSLSSSWNSSTIALAAARTEHFILGIPTRPDYSLLRSRSFRTPDQLTDSHLDKSLSLGKERTEE